MAAYLIQDAKSGLFLSYFGGLSSDHFWTDDPSKAWSRPDPREAAHYAACPHSGVRRPYKIKVRVVSTREVHVEPYTTDEMHARSVRGGPTEAFSEPCPQCGAKRGQPCVVEGGRGVVHGLRRRKFLIREAAKSEKTGRPNPYAGLRY